MNRFYNLLTKRWFFWPLLAVPGIWRMAIPALTDGLGFNPLFELLHRTGQIAIWMLVAVLSLSPLKTLFPRARLVAALNRHRRGIGVATFVYAAMHVTEHFLYEGGFDTYLANWKKPFFLTGSFGIITLFLLAITSNNFSVRRLTYPFWKWLHRLVYIAVVGLAWHVAIQGKGNWPFAKRVFIPLIVLETLRLIKLSIPALKRSWHKTAGSTPWDDWRPFRVARREQESDTITSFYLEPEDGLALPAFKPGQFLTIQVQVPGQSKPVVRTYTISDAPNPKYYRLSIKREESGLVSKHFHDAMAVGTTLQAKPPAGRFQLNATRNGPVVLLSGGVGITPMLAMMNSLAGKSDRPVWFLHGARNRQEHAFGAHVRGVSTKHKNIMAHICYSQPGASDVSEQVCNSAGRVDVELLKKLMVKPDGDFYLCGPGPFMKSLYEGLRGWGVPEERIHYEFFGPATVKLSEVKPNGTAATNGTWRVEFKPGGAAQWTDGSLLDLALARGLPARYGCKVGVCGSCACRVTEGKTRYAEQPSYPVKDGQVLICCARPETDVVVELEKPLHR